MDFNDENIEWLMQTSQTVEKLVDDFSGEKLAVFLNLLETEFLSTAVVKDTTAFGVLPTEECFRNLLRKLKAFGYFFAVRTSRTSKGSKLKIFHKSPPHLKIEHPYSVSKCVRLYCSVNLKIKPCPANMIMRQINMYTNFPRSNERQQKMNQKLRKAIANGTAKSEQQLWVSVSLPRAHNHAPGTNAETDRRGLDVDVKATMLQITSDGNLTVDDVKAKLKGRIDEEFAREGYGPSPDNRAFFPSDKVIYNHLRDKGLVKSRIRKSNDLKTLRLEINEKLRKIQEEVSKIGSKANLKKIIAWLTEFGTFKIK